MAEKIRVGITRDSIKADGVPAFGKEALKVLDDPNVEWEFLPEIVAELTPEHAARYDVLCVNQGRVTPATLARADRRVKLISRFGVGYDAIDIPACNQQGVIINITPDGVRRPVATNALTFMLALGQNLLQKDRITRAGRWGERLNTMAPGLTGKTVGVIGLGNIGAEFVRLAKPLDMQFIACDPHIDAAKFAQVGARRVDLDTLLREADFVSIHCPLSQQTRKLIGARELGLMKPTAYLINTARGPIVDESALYAALTSGKIAGAALDVFEQEPTPSDNPILQLDNVIVTPHHFCYTHECAHNIASLTFAAAVDVAHHRKPRNIVNKEALQHPSLQNWFGHR